MFSLESPHRGDSNEYTKYTIFNIQKKFTLNFPKSAAMGFFQGAQEQVRNSRGKRFSWLFRVLRPFETVFQSTSERLPGKEKEKRKYRRERKKRP